jgi:hypothetical protein
MLIIWKEVSWSIWLTQQYNLFVRISQNHSRNVRYIILTFRTLLHPTLHVIVSAYTTMTHMNNHSYRHCFRFLTKRLYWEKINYYHGDGFLLSFLKQIFTYSCRFSLDFRLNNQYIDAYTNVTLATEGVMWIRCGFWRTLIVFHENIMTNVGRDTFYFVKSSL